MNIFAHAWLANVALGTDEAVIGGFIADFIKGNPAHPRHGLTPGEIEGVKLHRQIDTFTDAHPAVAELRVLLRPGCGKYAGVAVDVLFDHLLLRDGSVVSTAQRSVFVLYFYRTVQNQFSRLPAPAGRMAQHMITHDWLTQYTTTQGIASALRGLSRRTAYPSGLETAVTTFQQHEAEFADAFARFWPDVLAEVQNWED